MTTPAGWYDDGSGALRWWDGTQWTAHVRTAAVPEAASTATPEPAPEAAPETTPSVEAEPSPAADHGPAPSVTPEAQVPAPDTVSSSTPDQTPFAPPYALPFGATPPSGTSASAVPAAPGAPLPPGSGYPYAVAPGYPGAPNMTPAPPAPATGVSVLGIIGLAVVVLGVVAACIPVIAIAGWALLTIGFILSLVSLFLRGRKWPGITGLVVAVVGAILALAVSLFLLAAFASSPQSDPPAIPAPSERPTPDDSAAPEASTDPADIEGAEMVPFAELQVGDCLPFVEYSADETIYELPVVPCDQPHTDEVFFIFDIDDEGEFPGDTALGETAWDGCLAQFESYVGIAYEDSALDFYTYQPTKGSWSRQHDRTVQCIMYSYEDVTGTLRGAGY